MIRQHGPFTVLTFATLITPLVDAEARRVSSHPRLTVLIENYAGVGVPTRMAAARLSQQIYQNAGVETAWIDCGNRSENEVRPPVCETLPSPDVVRVRIVPTLPNRIEGVGRFVFGFAMPTTTGGFGWAATIFWDRVMAGARTSGVTQALLLGCVMAHEVGHLLLGTNSHSSYGLMSGQWNRLEAQRISEGALGFVGTEKKKIQREVQKRTLAARASHAIR